jgi:hypothetical protein
MTRDKTGYALPADICPNNDIAETMLEIVDQITEQKSRTKVFGIAGQRSDSRRLGPMPRSADVRHPKRGTELSIAEHKRIADMDTHAIAIEFIRPQANRDNWHARAEAFRARIRNVLKLYGERG